MIPECLIGSFIKHKNTKDVCYFVNRISRLNGNYIYDLTIWNMGFEKSWVIDTCKSENLDLENFLFYNDVAVCLRNVNWQEIR